VDERAVGALRTALRAGGLALVPTDTVYGLVAALDSSAGVSALYAVKGRPRSQPCQVILFGDLLGEALAVLDPVTRRAAAALLPGPATCLVNDPAARYAAVAGSEAASVGLRAPAVGGPLARLGIPLAGTSANDPDGPDPARLEDVPARLLGAVACQVDGGPLPGTPSAVVDLRPVASGGAARLIRPGPDPRAARAALAGAGVDLADGGSR
jgi:L-threonylcarbamoyladenylate synthase